MFCSPSSALSSNETHKLDGLQPCWQVEADTRMILYVKDALDSAYRRVMTVDTDVVVLAVAYFHTFEEFIEQH